MEDMRERPCWTGWTICSITGHVEVLLAQVSALLSYISQPFLIFRTILPVHKRRWPDRDVQSQRSLGLQDDSWSAFLKKANEGDLTQA